MALTLEAEQRMSDVGLVDFTLAISQRGKRRCKRQKTL